MPSASDSHRARWCEPDGSIGWERVITFLKERDYILLPNWFWVIPASHAPTEEELDAIDFLIDEWDFSGSIKREDLNLNDTALNIIANAKVIK